jgi:hypothetical protein
VQRRSPVHSVFASSFFFGSAAEAIKTCGNADILQADLRQVLNEVLPPAERQRFNGPEIDVPAGILGEFDIQGRYRPGEGARPASAPHDFSKTAILPRSEIEDTVRAHDIDGAIRYRKSRRVALADFNVEQRCDLSRFAGSLKHRVCHIDADGLSCRSRPHRQKQQIHPRAAADV